MLHFDVSIKMKVMKKEYYVPSWQKISNPQNNVSAFLTETGFFWRNIKDKKSQLKPDFGRAYYMVWMPGRRSGGALLTVSSCFRRVFNFKHQNDNFGWCLKWFKIDVNWSNINVWLQHGHSLSKIFAFWTIWEESFDIISPTGNRENFVIEGQGCFHNLTTIFWLLVLTTCSDYLFWPLTTLFADCRNVDNLEISIISSIDNTWNEIDLLILTIIIILPFAWLFLIKVIKIVFTMF